MSTPYSGDPRPDGSLGAVPIPGQLEVDLPGGKVKCWYVVTGKPKTHFGGTSDDWDTSGLQPTFTPLGDAPPLEVKPSMLTNNSVSQTGLSKKRWLVLKVPKPGGRYLVTVPAGLRDDEAHMLIKD